MFCGGGGGGGAVGALWLGLGLGLGIVGKPLSLHNSVRNQFVSLQRRVGWDLDSMYSKC